MGGGLIGGTVHTENGEMLSGAVVSLSGNQMDVLRNEQTNIEGKYMFYDNLMHEDYELSAYKEDSHTKGVTTADIIKIHNHITGLEKLTSPYKIIAADVTSDEDVTIEDIAEIKSLVIGRQESFRFTSAWKFISDKYEFFDKQYPWPFIERMTIHNLESDMLDENFTAVKMGDVTNDVMGETELRSKPKVKLHVTNKYVKKNEYYEAEVRLASSTDISGIQGTIQLENNKQTQLLSGKLFAYPKDFIMANKKLSYSLHKIQNKKTDVLFTLTGVTDKEGFLEDLVDFNDVVTETEIYGSDGYGYDVDVEFVSENPSFMAGNFIPNPFKESAHLDVEMPAAGKLNYAVFSTEGKRIHQHSLLLGVGKHQLVLRKTDIKMTGFFTVVLEFKGYKEVRKIVIVK